MMKLTTSFGYDIYELSEDECDERFYEYPTFAVFVEGENYDTAGVEETSEASLNDALAWCVRYRRC